MKSPLFSRFILAMACDRNTLLGRWARLLGSIGRIGRFARCRLKAVVIAQWQRSFSRPAGF
jgi:hypothetical protein